MIVPVMAISNLVLTQQIYSEETNGAHAHNRDRVPLNQTRFLSNVVYNKVLPLAHFFVWYISMTYPIV